MSKQVILVTGASSGFGLMTARSLAQAGHTVYASMRETKGRNAQQVAAVAAWAAEQTVDLRTIELDVQSDASAEAGIAAILRDAGGRRECNRVRPRRDACGDYPKQFGDGPRSHRSRGARQNAPRHRTGVRPGRCCCNNGVSCRRGRKILRAWFAACRQSCGRGEPQDHAVAESREVPVQRAGELADPRRRRRGGSPLRHRRNAKDGRATMELWRANPGGLPARRRQPMRLVNDPRTCSTCAVTARAPSRSIRRPA